MSKRTQLTFVDYYPSPRKAIFIRWDGRTYRGKTYHNVSLSSRGRMKIALVGHNTRWDSAIWREQTIVVQPPERKTA